MRKDDLRGMTRLDLLEEARRLEIRGRNAMNKEQLVDAVTATVRPKAERTSTAPSVEAGPARRPRKTQGAEPVPPAREAKPRSRSGPAGSNVAAARPAVRRPAAARVLDEMPSSVAVRAPAATTPPASARPPADTSSPPSARPPADTSSPLSARPPARTPPLSSAHPPTAASSPSAARPPAGRPHGGTRGHHNPGEEDDEDGQNWNSTALGRDPNYGRFLGPGSIPSRNLPPLRRGPGGPPSPVARSLAERSELGRQRAGERSYGPREDLRRGAPSRRDSVQTVRYDRDRRPADPRAEHGRGRVDEHPGRGPQSVRGSQDGSRSGRPPGGPATDRRGPVEGHLERDDRRSPVDVRHEHGDRRALEGRGAGAAQVRPLGGPVVPDEMRRRGLRDGGKPAAEVSGPRGDSGGDSRPTVSAGVPEARPRVPEPSAPPPRTLDRCRLMVRDPYCVHAYWEVTEESVERITAELADELKGCRPILRVHGIPVSGDPDEPQAGFFDVDLAADATSAYVDVPRANRGYRVDVGLITAQMLFFPLASSNTVITPRDSASRNATETWAEPPAAGAPVTPGQPVGSVGRANTDPVGGVGTSGGGATVATGSPDGDPAVGVGSARGEPAGRAEGPGAEPAVGAASANGGAGADAARAAGDSIVSGASGTSRARRSSATAGKRPDGRLPAGDSGVGLAGEMDAGLALTGGRTEEGHGWSGVAGDSGAGLALGLDLAAASGRGLAPAGPGIPPGPTGPDEEGPSPGSIVREPKPFHFVVHTELVLYGAAEPGATVTLQGAPVALREDGTFSLRFQLPDGEQVLRAVAVSPDGNVERTITPVVTRRTVEQETKRNKA